MKIPKRINVKTALIFVVISILLTSAIFYAFAATPTSTFYISSGVYPGAPSYTVWREGSNYFAKDANGQIKYSGTNGGEVIQTAIDVVYDAGAGAGTIFLAKGTYVGNVWLKKNVNLIGEGIRSTVIQGTVTINYSTALSPIYLAHLTIDAKTPGEDYGLELQGTVGALHALDLRIAGKRASIHVNGTAQVLECSFEEIEMAWDQPIGILIEGHLWLSTFTKIFINNMDYGIIQNSTDYVMWMCIFDDLIFSVMAKKAMHIERMQLCMFRNLYVGDSVVGADQPLILLKNTIDTTVCFGNIFEGGTLSARANEYVMNISDYYDSTKISHVDFNKVYASKIRIDSTATNTLIDSPLNLAFADIDDDSTSTHYRGLGWDRGTSFPTSPKTGQQFYRTDLYALYIWNSTHWVATGTGATGPAGPAGTLEGKQPYSYLIFKNATATYMLNGETGDIDDYDTDSATVFNWVENNLTSGGLVIIKRETYTMTSQITMNNGEVTFRGEQWDAVTLLAHSSLTNPMFYVTSSNNVIEDMTIDMNDYGTHGIHISHAQKNIVRNVYIDEAVNDGIRLTATSERNSNKIIDCTIRSAGDYGIYIGNDVGHCWITRNIISDVLSPTKDTLVGISVNYGGQNQIYDNSLWGLAIGIELGTNADVYRAQIESNTITGCDIGIKITGSYCRTVNINDNLFWSNNEQNYTGDQYSDIYITLSNYASGITINDNIAYSFDDVAITKAWHFIFVMTNDLQYSTIVGNVAEDYWGTVIEDGGHASVVNANNVEN